MVTTTGPADHANGKHGKEGEESEVTKGRSSAPKDTRGNGCREGRATNGNRDNYAANALSDAENIGDVGAVDDMNAVRT